jgi:hypothetical protein
MRAMKMMKSETVELQKVLENLRTKKYIQLPKELVKQIADLEEKYMTDRNYAMREIEKLVDDFIKGEAE